MKRARQWVANAIASLIKSDNVDLYVLVIGAGVYTVLGARGIASAQILSAVILACLATLAFSQLKMRRQVTAIARSSSPDPSSLFRTTFPDELIERRGRANTFLYIGVSMTRTVQTSKDDIKRILSNGGRVRVLLLDPTNEALVHAADQHNPTTLDVDRLSARIRTSLDELGFLRDSTRGSGVLEIRVAAFVPRLSMNGIDLESGDGLLCVQHYEHRPQGEPSPIFSLAPRDAFWFQRFAAEAERIWESGTPWPLPTSELVRRATLGFSEHFGPELTEGVKAARTLLVSGVARNGFVIDNYSTLEGILRGGAKLRFLLVDPASAAAQYAADRYYADREVTSVIPRIEQTLRLLRELTLIPELSGSLEVRLTTHPVAMGVVGIDVEQPTSMNSCLFLEYFSYRTGGELKFAVRPNDARTFGHLLNEAEELWESATVVPDSD